MRSHKLNKLKVGLALAGGGARGIAHIGIFKHLHGKIPISHLSGTSAGGIIAAMYAYRQDPDWMEQHFRDYLESEVYRDLGISRLARQRLDAENESAFTRKFKSHVAVNLSLMRQFVVDRERFTRALRFLIPVNSFEELSLPLTVCATDLNSGHVMAYRSGDLINALANSASIPGVLESEILDDGSVMADGGVMTPVPVAQLKPHTDFVIASEISRRSLPALEEHNIFRLMMRSEHLGKMELARFQAREADFVMMPNVMSLHWSRFDEFDFLLDAGESEAREQMSALMDRLRIHSSIMFRLRTRLADWIAAR